MKKITLLLAGGLALLSLPAAAEPAEGMLSYALIAQYSVHCNASVDTAALNRAIAEEAVSSPDAIGDFGRDFLEFGHLFEGASAETKSYLCKFVTDYFTLESDGSLKMK